MKIKTMRRKKIQTKFIKGLRGETEKNQKINVNQKKKTKAPIHLYCIKHIFIS